MGELTDILLSSRVTGLAGEGGTQALRRVRRRTCTTTNVVVVVVVIIIIIIIRGRGEDWDSNNRRNKMEKE